MLGVYFRCEDVPWGRYTLGVIFRCVDDLWGTLGVIFRCMDVPSVRWALLFGALTIHGYSGH